MVQKIDTDHAITRVLKVQVQVLSNAGLYIVHQRTLPWLLTTGG